jgi:hypothetical protein
VVRGLTNQDHGERPQIPTQTEKKVSTWVTRLSSQTGVPGTMTPWYAGAGFQGPRLPHLRA